MQSTQIHGLILAHLIRNVGGTRQHWRRAVGNLRVFPIATHAHCNWDVYPSGTAADIRAVNEAVDEIRERHPLITG